MCYFDKVWGIYRENYTAPYKEANRIKLVKTRCGYLHIAHGYQTPIQRLINREAYNLSFEKYNFVYVYHQPFNCNHKTKAAVC